MHADDWMTKRIRKTVPPDTVTLTLPQTRPDVTVPVVELFLK